MLSDVFTDYLQDMNTNVLKNLFGKKLFRNLPKKPLQLFWTTHLIIAVKKTKNVSITVPELPSAIDSIALENECLKSSKKLNAIFAFWMIF